MCIKGDGIQQDCVLAQMYFNLASPSGYTAAIQNSDNAAPLKTSDQIAIAQKMVHEWVQKHR